jgi:hypothetical protein
MPTVSYGSFALDDGNFTLSEAERAAILHECPEAESFMRPFVGGQELIRAEKRWCIWLVDSPPDAVRRCSPIRRRVEEVRQWRAARGRATTRELASVPALFAEIRQPEHSYLAFPTVSSIRRPYIPIAFLPVEVIASNHIYIVPDATTFHFGVLTSVMHMAWVRSVCGRMKSDYRYSAGIVYNNFPWPDPTDEQRATIETAAQGVLDARAQFPTSTLADLYDPLSMPPELVKAHRAVDKAVDAAYGKAEFRNEAARVAYLFDQYQRLTAPIEASARPRPKPRRSK